MLAFRLLPFIQALILIFAFVYPLKTLSYKIKIPLAIILTLCSLKIYIFLLFFNSFMDPNFGRYPTIVINILYMSAIFLSLFTLLRMMINTLYKLVRLNKKSFIIPSSSKRYALLSIICAFAIGTTGVLNGFASPKIQNFTIKVDNLKTDKLTIAHLSDLHISSPTTKDELYDLVKRTNDLKADVIVITGDFVDGSVQNLDYLTKILFKLKAKYGVYGVSGNHEFYSGYKEWVDYFNQGGLKFLENQSVTLKDDNGNSIVNLVGLIDLAASRYHHQGYDINQALEYTDRSVENIFLVHQPVVAIDLEPYSILTLSGHTHGGLVKGFDSLIAKANGGFVNGHYKLGDENIIVSPGTRIWAGMPFRLGVSATINYITLKK